MTFRCLLSHRCLRRRPAKRQRTRGHAGVDVLPCPPGLWDDSVCFALARDGSAVAASPLTVRLNPAGWKSRCSLHVRTSPSSFHTSSEFGASPATRYCPRVPASGSSLLFRRLLTARKSRAHDPLVQSWSTTSQSHFKQDELVASEPAVVQHRFHFLLRSVKGRVLSYCVPMATRAILERHRNKKPLLTHYCRTNLLSGPRSRWAAENFISNPVPHHSHPTLSTLCKRKVTAYLLLNDSVMASYIINQSLNTHGVTATEVSHTY